MRFTKVQGLGNDFVLVNCLEEKINPEQLADLALKACSRHLGIGADGLVLLYPSAVADIKMRIFNADGSEAEMCGNGIRCAAKYLYENSLVNKSRLRMETAAGIIIPELNIKGGRVDSIRVDMGEPQLQRAAIPMIGPPGKVVNQPLQAGEQIFHLTAVSMGNPHCVIFVPQLEQVELALLGPLLEKQPVFPHRTNVEFVQIVDRGEVLVKVWERGAGETMACGTGACAVAVAGAMNDYTDRQLTVRLKGGALLIEWAADNHVYMTGQAEIVFTGEYP